MTIRVGVPPSIQSATPHRPAGREGPPLSRKPVTAVTAVTRILRMTVAEYIRSDLAVELEVPWSRDHLWLVPSADKVDLLVAQKVARGAIWIPAELTGLLGIDGLRETDRGAIARLRTAFGAQIVSVEPWSADRVPGPAPTCCSCGGARQWKSVHGAVVCATCHPPADPSLVSEWIDPRLSASIPPEDGTGDG